MKIPKTFIPEKDFENKILNLIKGYKILHNEEVYDVISKEEAEVYYMICMAEEVVKKLGNYCSAGDYNFKDKENKLIIKQQFSKGLLELYLKKGLFRKEKVLEFSQYPKLTPFYALGEWKKDLEKLYATATQT